MFSPALSTSAPHPLPPLPQPHAPPLVLTFSVPRSTSFTSILHLAHLSRVRLLPSSFNHSGTLQAFRTARMHSWGPYIPGTQGIKSSLYPSSMTDCMAEYSHDPANQPLIHTALPDPRPAPNPNRRLTGISSGDPHQYGTLRRTSITR